MLNKNEKELIHFIGFINRNYPSYTYEKIEKDYQNYINNNQDYNLKDFINYVYTECHHTIADNFAFTKILDSYELYIAERQSQKVLKSEISEEPINNNLDIEDIER